MKFRVNGKVLVVISDHNSDYPCINVYPQSGDNGCPGSFTESRDALCNDVPDHLRAMGLGLSKRQMKMPDGTTFRIKMTVELSYSSDYFGVWDSDMKIVKACTLRVQKPSRKMLKRWKLQDKRLDDSLKQMLVRD